MKFVLDSTSLRWSYPRNLEGHPPVVQFKAKLIAFYFLVAISCGAVAAVTNVILGFYDFALYQGVILGLASFFVVHHRKHGPLDLGGDILSACILSYALIHQIHTCGMNISAAPWVIASPVPALLYSDRRRGFGWSVGAFLTFGVMWVMEHRWPVHEPLGWGQTLLVQSMVVVITLVFLGLILCMHEVTQRQMVADVETQSGRSAEVLKTIQEGVVLLGEKGEILGCNPNATTMFGPSASALTHIQQVLPGWRQATGPLSGVHRLGEGEVMVELSQGAIRGEGERFVLVMHDVTQKQAMVAQLREARDEALSASRAKSAFLAMMSHELRTPLNAILGYTELLQEEFEEREVERKMVDDLMKISFSGKHLLSIVGNVLDLTKIEAGHASPTPELFALGALIEDVTTPTQGSLHRKPVQFVQDIQLPLGLQMLADRAKLRQILINLLGNALKFTQEGTIVLRVSGQGEQVQFEVEDTGPGIPLEAQPHVFEAFKQADNTSTRRHDGSGLGLAISQKFAHLLGATLFFESVEGTGTTFTLCVPRGMGLGEVERACAN